MAEQEIGHLISRAEIGTKTLKHNEGFVIEYGIDWKHDNGFLYETIPAQRVFEGSVEVVFLQQLDAIKGSTRKPTSKEWASVIEK